MKPEFYRRILERHGWTMIGDIVKEKNCIFLEAPHTSIWDFLIGYLYYRAVGGKLRIMIKKEAFFWPFKYILTALGGFPIDRKNPSGTIRSIMAEMNSPESDRFHLAICPEGTRKPVRRWKTGYHLIAKETGVNVYLTMVDWGHKRVGIFHKFDLTDDAMADTLRIQQLYKEAGVIGKYPENFLTE